jgi:hypothetical protein
LPCRHDQACLQLLSTDILRYEQKSNFLHG